MLTSILASVSRSQNPGPHHARPPPTLLLGLCSLLVLSLPHLCLFFLQSHLKCHPLWEASPDVLGTTLLLPLFPCIPLSRLL